MAGSTPTTGARRAFLAAAVRRPGQIGAVFPSSPRLAGLLASVVPSHGAPVVVELGPGSGSVSAPIADRLPAGGRHLAVELDPALAAYLRRSRPGMEVVDGDARELTSLLAAREAGRVDAVVSGLPWSLFGQADQRAILAQVSAVIGGEGAFTTFAYTHTLAMSSARRFRRLLHEAFDEVVITRTVWRNVPPAYAYVCRRPVTA
ncbi:class I SAM-dependent methyltransferase [Pseudonocardia xishanensis]|uniref:class I SAM-dependent methyltransferase n=1 Tax=Pseudonocardia xishanensis TaxID=630995 RepID=UPI0031E69A85